MPMCAHTCLCLILVTCNAGKGFIKGVDFANSLVTAADIKVVDSYLDKVRQPSPTYSLV